MIMNISFTAAAFTGLLLLTAPPCLASSSVIVKMELDLNVANNLALAGYRLSATEAEQLEREITANPEELAARIKLLGYYFGKRSKNPDYRKKYKTHVLWFIQNYPEAEIYSYPAYFTAGHDDDEALEAAKKLWLDHVKAQPKNTIIIDHAATFLRKGNYKETVEELLKKGRSLEPKNPHWSSRLGDHYLRSIRGSLEQMQSRIASKALKELVRALKLTPSKDEPLHRYHQFQLYINLAKAAYLAGRDGKATRYAKRILKDVSVDDLSSNEAQHEGHTILGLVALKSNDVGAAKKHLIDSVSFTECQKPIGSYRTSMSLSKALLDRDERNVVLEYLDICAKFWDGKKEKIQTWKNQITEGKTPRFGTHLRH